MLDFLTRLLGSFKAIVSSQDFATTVAMLLLTFMIQSLLEMTSGLFSFLCKKVFNRLKKKVSKNKKRKKKKKRKKRKRRS